MPKDDWKKAKDKQIARAEAHRLRQEKRRNSKAKQEPSQFTVSESTKLWFGKHKGKTIKTVIRTDRAYLKWLATSGPARNWKMDALKRYIAWKLNSKKKGEPGSTT